MSDTTVHNASMGAVELERSSKKPRQGEDAGRVQEGSDGFLDDGTVRINVWASPRSLSTALMYSFAQVCDDQHVLFVQSHLS